MIYKTSKVGGKYVDYTNPVEYTAGGDLRVSARAILADGSSTSGDSELYTIQQDASHVKKTMTVATPIVGVYDINGNTIDGSASSTPRRYEINVGKEIKVTGYEKSGDKVFYKWAAAPDVVVFSDPHSPTTTFTMPDSDFTLTAEYRALPTGGGITQNTNIDLDAGKPAGKSLSLRSGPNDIYSEWRHLTYQWYEGDSTTGTLLDNFAPFEIGKTYTARVTITVTEGCTFADGAGVQTKTSPSNGFIRVAEDKLARAAGKSIAFDLHLLTMPELTMELAPGDPLPTAEALTDQLPGFTVTPTWQDGVTTAPDSATVTLSKLEIKPVDGSYQLANCSVWINGTEYTGEYGRGSSTLTLTGIPVPVKPEGVEVSGTVKSYNPNNPVTVRLIEQGYTGASYEITINPTTGKRFVDEGSERDVLSLAEFRNGIEVNGTKGGIAIASGSATIVKA